LRAIDGAGGVIVAMEACSGMKPYMSYIEEGTGDPIRALAKHYLEIPCSCMTPNNRRLDRIDELIERFKPDALVDVILQACHSYSIESYKVGEHVHRRLISLMVMWARSARGSKPFWRYADDLRDVMKKGNANRQ
jgi:benzoyl-CoA reductase/2-hydroxyglutaryl-CoA dehydratase subunit BcrC/BadD/HgdB